MLGLSPMLAMLGVGLEHYHMTLCNVELHVTQPHSHKLKGNGKVKFFTAPATGLGYRCQTFVGTSLLSYIVELAAKNSRRTASEVTIQQCPLKHN